MRARKQKKVESTWATSCGESFFLPSKYNFSSLNSRPLGPYPLIVQPEKNLAPSSLQDHSKSAFYPFLLHVKHSNSCSDVLYSNSQILFKVHCWLNISPTLKCWDLPLCQWISVIITWLRAKKTLNSSAFWKSSIYSYPLTIKNGDLFSVLVFILILISFIISCCSHVPSRWIILLPSFGFF